MHLKHVHYMGIACALKKSLGGLGAINKKQFSLLLMHVHSYGTHRSATTTVELGLYTVELV